MVNGIQLDEFNTCQFNDAGIVYRNRSRNIFDSSSILILAHLAELKSAGILSLHMNGVMYFEPLSTSIKSNIWFRELLYFLHL